MSIIDELESQCKILAEEKQHLEAMVHKLKKEYEIEKTYLKNQIQNERDRQNQWKSLYFQEHAELVELKRRLISYQNSSSRSSSLGDQPPNQHDKWDARNRETRKESNNSDDHPGEMIPNSEKEMIPIRASPRPIYPPHQQHNMDRWKYSSSSSQQPHPVLIREEEPMKKQMTHHNSMLPPRERYPHSQLFTPGPRQQQFIHERQPVPQYFKCPICKIYYDTEQKLHFHMELHNERFVETIIVPQPPQQLDYPDSSLSTSPLDYYVCSECNQNFSSEEDYKRHLLVHIFKCRFCNITLENEESFLYHMKGHGEHTSLPYTCILCGQQFPHVQHLHGHILTHPAERPYSCQECNKNFTRKGHLTRHMAIHSKERPYACKDCPKTFAHKTHLRRHEIVHSGVRPFKCRLCDQAFSRKSSLSRHYFIHTTEKPFVCPVCDKGFNRKGRLKNHLKIHIREGHTELSDYVIERRPITKEFIERINNLKPENESETPSVQPPSMSNEFNNDERNRANNVEPPKIPSLVDISSLRDIKEESDEFSSSDSEIDENDGDLGEEMTYPPTKMGNEENNNNTNSYPVSSVTMVNMKNETGDEGQQLSHTSPIV